MRCCEAELVKVGYLVWGCKGEAQKRVWRFERSYFGQKLDRVVGELFGWRHQE